MRRIGAPGDQGVARIRFAIKFVTSKIAPHPSPLPGLLFDRLRAGRGEGIRGARPLMSGSHSILYCFGKPGAEMLDHSWLFFIAPVRGFV
jgi:hypothetical protein